MPLLIDIKKIHKKWNEVLIKTVRSRLKTDVQKTKIFSQSEKVLIRELKKDKIDFAEKNNEYKLLFLLEKISEIQFKKNRKTKRIFVVLSGPSGSGKGTYGKELEKIGFHKFPTTNTRLPRPTDRAGIDFIFVSVEKFHRLAKSGEFLQFRQTHGDWHGISRRLLEKKIKNKEKFYLERSVFSLSGFYDKMRDLAKKEGMNFPNYLSIIFLPPSFSELYHRLTSRTKEEKNKGLKNGQTILSDKKLLGRLETAIEQLKESAKAKFDLYLINNKIPRVRNKILKYLDIKK